MHTNVTESHTTQELIRELDAPISVVIKTDLKSPHDSVAMVVCDGVKVHGSNKDDPVLFSFIDALRSTLEIKDYTSTIVCGHKLETFRAILK